MLANPRLTQLISSWIGPAWTRDLAELRALQDRVDDRDLCSSWRDVKHANKRHFARYVHKELGVSIDPDSLFDVLVKRIHEYKRQHLSILHVIALYLRLKDGRAPEGVPRTFIFGGKAAPGYRIAKLIIKLITAVAATINRDPATREWLRVVFVPNFCVRTAQQLYPCADLSEQISTAGKEASGTGNMKFTLNGAVTIGTLDGANIEIRDEVGAENFFLFGLDAAEVLALKQQGYQPAEVYRTQPQIKEVLDLIRSGFFSRGDAELFRPLIDGLLAHDPYLVLADFNSFLECQRRVAAAYADRERWTRMSILNVARSGKFSSDRAIGEYLRDIWRADPVRIRLISQDDIRGSLLQ